MHVRPALLMQVHSTCGLRFKLRAQGPEQLKQWVQVLRAVLLLPEPPGISTTELKALVAKLHPRP